MHGEAENDVAEMDEEAVSPAPQLDRSVLIHYDIIYSETYQVPVLYLSVEGQSYRRLSLDEVYSILTRASTELELRNIGVLGALSLVDHPVHGTPVYMIHPCRTQEAMQSYPPELQSSPLRYMLLWFGLFGNHVGLSIPPALVLQLQQEHTD